MEDGHRGSRGAYATPQRQARDRVFPSASCRFLSPATARPLAFGKFLADKTVLRISLPVHIKGELDEGPKALLAVAQLILCPLPISDVAHQAQKPTAALLKLAKANLHRKRRAVLAPVTRLKSDSFPGDGALLEALDRRIVETHVEIAFVFSDQFFSGVTEAMAGLAVDVEDGPVIIKHKERITGVFHEGSKARLACAQLVCWAVTTSEVVKKTAMRTISSGSSIRSSNSGGTKK